MTNSCSLDCFHYPHVNAKTVFLGIRNVPNSVGACRLVKTTGESNYDIKRKSLLLCDEKDKRRMKGAHALGATFYLALTLCFIFGAIYIKRKKKQSSGRIYLVIAGAVAFVASAIQWVRVATVPSCKYTDKSNEQPCPKRILPCKKSSDHLWVESASEGELKRFNYMTRQEFSDLYPHCPAAPKK